MLVLWSGTFGTKKITGLKLLKMIMLPNRKEEKLSIVNKICFLSYVLFLIFTLNNGYRRVYGPYLVFIWLICSCRTNGCSIPCWCSSSLGLSLWSTYRWQWNATITPLTCCSTRQSGCLRNLVAWSKELWFSLKRWAIFYILLFYAKQLTQWNKDAYRALHKYLYPLNFLTLW